MRLLILMTDQRELKEGSPAGEYLRLFQCIVVNIRKFARVGVKESIMSCEVEVNEAVSIRRNTRSGSSSAAFADWH